MATRGDPPGQLLLAHPQLQGVMELDVLTRTLECVHLAQNETIPRGTHREERSS